MLIGASVVVEALEPIASRALGGVRVEVDADPFSGEAAVLAADGDVITFPGVSEVVLYVSPGTYTLDVWLVDQTVPYGYTPYPHQSQPTHRSFSSGIGLWAGLILTADGLLMFWYFALLSSTQGCD